MTKDQILTEIANILSDSRMLDYTAEIQINAPLALIQLSLTTRLHTLQDVLDMPRTNVNKLRETHNRKRNE